MTGGPLGSSLLLFNREDWTLEAEFNEKELSEFWLRWQQKYPVISKAALVILMPFASTYFCETDFYDFKL